MPTVKELFSDLNSVQINKVLEAAHLENKENYTQLETDLIEECILYITEGKSTLETAILVELERINATRISDDEKIETLQLHDLIRISKEFDYGVTLSETAQLLNAIRLPERDRYTIAESILFLKAAQDKARILKPRKIEDEILDLGIDRGKTNAEILAKVTKEACLKFLPEALLNEFASTELTDAGKIDQEAILIDLQENWPSYRQRYLTTESSSQNLLPESSTSSSPNESE